MKELNRVLLDLFKDDVTEYINYNYEINKLSYNDSNFKMVEDEIDLDFIAYVIAVLSAEDLENIHNNKEVLKDLMPLLPFVGKTNIESLSTDNFIRLLINYPTIKETIKERGFGSVNRSNIIEYIDLLIKFNSNYNTNHLLSTSLLGEAAVGPNKSKVFYQEKSYIDTYIDTNNRMKSSIPYISVEAYGHTFENIDQVNNDRLFIGRVTYDGSCITPGDAGSFAYKELLTESTADVIIERDKNNKQVHRILCFRRGDTIILMPQESYDNVVLNRIANAMIKKANEVGDNLKNIVCTRVYDTNLYLNVDDPSFESCVPHSAADSLVYVLYPKHKESISYDLESTVKPLYIKERRPVIDNPPVSELMRIKALAVYVEEDDDEQVKKTGDFSMVWLSDYESILCGENWYVALRKDGTIESVYAKTNDPRGKVEFENALQSIEEIKTQKNSNQRRKG